MQATAVNENQLQTRSNNHPQLVNQNELVPKMDFLPQKSIRQIEQLTLKQPMQEPIVQSFDSPKKNVNLKPEPKKEEFLLEEPKQKKELEQKKREAIRKAELKKREEQLDKKQKEHEAKELKLVKERKRRADELAKAIQNEVNEGSIHNEAQDSNNTSVTAIDSSSANNVEQGEIDKYKQLIIEAISRKWLVPETDKQDLACQLLVHVGPGGVVMNIDILKGSGDDQLDRSATNAIMKASPLPVPETSNLFDNFRALRLTFRPQGIVSN